MDWSVGQVLDTVRELKLRDLWAVDEQAALGDALDRVIDLRTEPAALGPDVDEGDRSGIDAGVFVHWSLLNRLRRGGGRRQPTIRRGPLR